MMSFRRPTVTVSAVVTLTLSVVGACNSPQESVCENIGACEQGGSSDWITKCDDDAKALLAASAAAGCDGFFAVYYRCANDAFTCNGATASFPGCEEKRGNLDDCLTRQQASTACGELAKKTANCGTLEAGVPLVEVGCTASRECAVRCYLDNVADACAPRADEIAATSTCTASCR